MNPQEFLESIQGLKMHEAVAKLVDYIDHIKRETLLVANENMEWFKTDDAGLVGQKAVFESYIDTVAPTKGDSDEH